MGPEYIFRTWHGDALSPIIIQSRDVYDYVAKWIGSHAFHSTENPCATCWHFFPRENLQNAAWVHLALAKLSIILNSAIAEG